MPPSKANRNHDDGKPESGSTGKNGGPGSAKMRRITSQQGGSNLREVQNASATSAARTAAAKDTADTTPSLNWSSFDRDTLHRYNREHGLNAPNSFVSTFHQTVLSQPSGIGLYSPTMLRKKKQRQSKEQLARTIRKHFNGQGVNENDVIPETIFKVRNDNAERARGPQKPNIVSDN